VALAWTQFGPGGRLLTIAVALALADLAIVELVASQRVRTRALAAEATPRALGHHLEKLRVRIEDVQ
jgi:hypothetical protein